MIEPLRANAGDTWTWTRLQPAYPPADGWALTYYFGLGANAPQVITATAVGEAFVVTVDAADTSLWPAGLYRWTARVSNTITSETFTVDEGVLTVDPDPSTTYDRRSSAEINYAIIDAALQASAGDMIVEYQIDGVRVKKDRASAIKERARYLAIIRLQKGRPFFTHVPVRFP